MKKSTKMALLSALVFPGVGQFVLKRWAWGMFFMCPALFGLGIVISYHYKRAMDAVDRILSGEIYPDLASITQLLSEKPPAYLALILSLSIYLFLACWIGSTVDAYIKGQEASEIREQSI